ncbi:MAG: imidazole glycerol phosphate synthase subunit HisH [Planctomycetota bacterium]
MTEEIVVVPTGTANLASVRSAFTRLGASVRLARGPSDVLEAEFVVLPGVGALRAAIDQVDALGLREPLRLRVEEQRPTLAICLGFQMLCAASEESPGALGLGCIDREIERFGSDLRVPHLGWNDVEPGPGSFLEPGQAYFAHSFLLRDVPEGWQVARTEYGSRFVSAVQRGAVLGCQFHPELSGSYGERLLGRWLQNSREALRC